MKEEIYENYPKPIIILSNLTILICYAIGVIILAGFGSCYIFDFLPGAYDYSNEEIISFAGGLPNSEFFPVKEIADAKDDN